MADGGDIIIRGGSCNLIFNDSIYPADPGDPGSHKNKDNQKVTRVIITGDISYDSGDHPNGLTCEIHTYTK